MLLDGLDDLLDDGGLLDDAGGGEGVVGGDGGSDHGGGGGNGSLECFKEIDQERYVTLGTSSHQSGLEPDTSVKS